MARRGPIGIEPLFLAGAAMEMLDRKV